MKRADVLAYPEQIGDALWRVEAAGVPSGAVKVGGADQGAAELAAQIVGDRGVGGHTIKVCASYSGDDNAALECFAQGGRRVAVCTAGALAARARDEAVPVVGVPSGLSDPRAAVIYFTVAAVICGAPQLRAELEAAAPKLAQLAEGGEVELQTPAERALGARLREDLAASEP